MHPNFTSDFTSKFNRSISFGSSKIDSILFYQHPPAVAVGTGLSVSKISLTHKKQINAPKELFGQLIVAVSPYGAFGHSARLTVGIELARNARLYELVQNVNKWLEEK